MGGAAGPTAAAGRRARPGGSPSRAITGIVTATAVIAATGSGTSADQALEATAATLAVFWLTHVYAEAVADQLERRRPSWARVRAAMAAELPVLRAPAPLLLVLLAGAVGALPGPLALTVAVWAGVAQLAGWGVAYAHRLGRPWPAALLAGAVNGALGMVIVALKALLH